MEWENSLNALTVCCSSHSATQVDGLTPVQEAAVAVFSFAEHWTLWLLQCSLAALLSGATWCVWVCVSNCVNSPEASMGVAACPTAADVCWMDKSTHNPLGLAAGSCHGPFLLFAFLSFSCFFLRISLSLSLSLPFKALFKIFHLCTLYFSFFIFLYYFFGASQAHRRTGNYHCGRKLAASFPVYTQTHICTLLHIHHRSEPPLVRLPMQTNQKQLHSTEAFIFLYLQAEGALKRLKLTLTVIYLSGRRLRWAAAKLKLKALDYHSRIFIWPCFNQVLIPTHACTCRSCSSVLQQVDSPMERWSVEVSMGRREWLISTISAAGAVLSGGLILKKKGGNKPRSTNSLDHSE